MSLLGNLLHRATGAANDFAEAHQNVGADARQSVRDLEANLTKAEGALVDVRAEGELLKGKREKAQAEVDRWLHAAQNAAGKDDDLARQCLEKKAAAKVQLDAVDAAIAKFQPTVDALTKHIDEMRAQKDQLANQADLIGVRSEVADVEMHAAEIIGGIGGHGVNLTAAEDALAKKEAKAHAASSIIAEHNGGDLEAKVAALNASSSIDDELAALKAGK